MLSEKELRKETRLRAEVKLGVYFHLAVYSSANVMLFFHLVVHRWVPLVCISVAGFGCWSSRPFIAELSQITIKKIRSFCDQGFSEGSKIEYKRDFPETNLKLAETICAFANAEGGIILIGVEADKQKNIPRANPWPTVYNNLYIAYKNIPLNPSILILNLQRFGGGK